MPTCSMKYGIQGGSSPHLFAPFTPMIESGGGFVTRGFSFKGAQMSIRALRARTFLRLPSSLRSNKMSLQNEKRKINYAEVITVLCAAEISCWRVTRFIPFITLKNR